MAIDAVLCIHWPATSGLISNPPLNSVHPSAETLTRASEHFAAGNLSLIKLHETCWVDDDDDDDCLWSGAHWRLRSRRRQRL
jgi:hypothetical protein